MGVKERQYFSYMGMFNITPLFSEGVIWTVFISQIKIKGESLNLLRRNIMRQTYRPI